MRISSQKGESITEVLVATAIGGLALLMLAMAISAAVHMTMASRDSLDKYYTASNVIAEAEEISIPSDGGSLEVTLVEYSDKSTAVSLVDNELQASYFRFGSDTAGMDSVVAYMRDFNTSALELGGA